MRDFEYLFQALAEESADVAIRIWSAVVTQHRPVQLAEHITYCRLCDEFNDESCTKYLTAVEALEELVTE